MKRLARKHKGQVLVIVAIALVVLLAMVGLALDIGIAYGVKAKLFAAVDAAAIAAGRAIKQGSSDTIRIRNAQDAGIRFFNANFPSRFMGATVSTPTINAVHNADGSWSISANGSASSPAYFARVLGWNQFTLGASAETTVRTLDMILVLDCSGSLKDTSQGGESPPGTFNKLKDAAISFLSNFSDGSGGDRIGLVVFASGVEVPVGIYKDATRGFDKADMTTAIRNLSAGGSTASGEALRKAKEELDGVDPNYRSSLRVIVFFSDGAPNDVAGTFDNGVTGDLYSEPRDGDINHGCPHKAHRTFAVNRRNSSSMENSCNINTLPEKDYTNTVNLESDNGKRTLQRLGNGKITNTLCNVNMAARNMVENVANAARSGTGNNTATIYTLGLGGTLHMQEFTQDPCYNPNDKTEWGENILKRIANASDADTHNSNQPTGLYVYAANADELQAAFQTIANQVLRLSK